jgi:hypothetical protein
VVAARDWPVTETSTEFNADVSAWRHDGRDGAYTLCISREVLDCNAADTLPELLDKRHTQEALREVPQGRAILRYDGGLLVLRYFEKADS